MSNPSRRRILTTGALGAAGLVATAASQLQTTAQTQATAQASAIPDAAIPNPSRKFQNKVVLITGATSGIGETTARAFAAEGAKVFFCGRRESLGQTVEREIRSAGGEATYVRADVRQVEQVKAFVEACVTQYGRLDIAFNNAGTDYPPHKIADTPISEFDDLMNTNARGVFLGMKYEIPYMLEAGGGAIVNMASIGGYRAFPNIVGYGASKAAVIL
jgi:NAD(P)-dependent dehydrogenase (short-subunit alcohol dehydrogenase family)